MNLLTEPEPPRHVPTAIAPGIRRLVACNPGPMTYWGTNTYLIDAGLTGAGAGLLVLDPGPDDPAHVAALLATAGAPIVGILLSHGHADHIGAAASLRAATGAPIHAWHGLADPALVPDIPVNDGDRVFGWTAIHTPGHAADHLCFAGQGGTMFSADHVMGWSTSVVGPPGGSMAHYMDSLRRLIGRTEEVFLPGHGPPIPAPNAHVQALLAHREAREAAVLAALRRGDCTIPDLVAALYPTLDPALHRAAERNVAAHLQKLAEERQAGAADGVWSLA